MTTNQFKVVGLGEVLWDVSPTRKTLGGAPANFAYISAGLGDSGVVASRVGDDADGTAAISTLKTSGVGTAHIQIDSARPTGKVAVSLIDGQPEYQIFEQVAWDFLEMNDDWRGLARSCDAVCFGSLAQRNPISRNAVMQFVRETCLSAWRIFDVNLRQSFYSEAILRESIQVADAVKLNHEELGVIAQLFDLEGTNEIELAQNLLQHFDVQLICLTRGAAGSLLITKTAVSQHAGIKVRIADAIGAGDAFTATLAHGLLRDRSLDEINEKANRVAAFVASNTGAMPPFEPEKIWQASA